MVFRSLANRAYVDLAQSWVGVSAWQCGRITYPDPKAAARASAAARTGT